MPWAAVPAFLTPLTATLVHSGLIHLGFNMLIFLWCGARSSACSAAAASSSLYLVGAYAAAARAMGGRSARQRADDRRERRDQRGDRRFCAELRPGQAVHRHLRVNRWINVVWLMVAWVVLQVMMGWLAGGQGYLLATPAHVGGFAAGLLLQRPLLLWRYRKA